MKALAKATRNLYSGRPVPEGANLSLIDVKSPDELLFRQTLNGLWLASAIRVYLDLLRGEGRAKDPAAHSRRERIGRGPSLGDGGVIRYIRGNLLQADTEAVVNAVNTVGVMGRASPSPSSEPIPRTFDLRDVYDSERHLLHVACTRARDHLYVSGGEPASEFLEDLNATVRNHGWNRSTILTSGNPTRRR